MEYQTSSAGREGQGIYIVSFEGLGDLCVCVCMCVCLLWPYRVENCSMMTLFLFEIFLSSLSPSNGAAAEAILIPSPPGSNPSNISKTNIHPSLRVINATWLYF